MLKKMKFLRPLIVFVLTFCGGTVSFADGHSEKSSSSLNVMATYSVVELFTSQGCSSCPPADVLLQKYVQDPHIIALSYSVDYWDYLGWKDTYGSPKNSTRQRNYARARGDGSVYTPQAIVNGLEHMNGASQYKINTNIEVTKKKLKSQLVRLNVTDDGSERVRIWSSDKTAKGAVLWMVQVKDKADVAIRRGENRGRTIAYHNIVLGVEKVADFGQEGVDFTVARTKLQPKDGKHTIFIAQVGASGPVLGAIEIK